MKTSANFRISSVSGRHGAGLEYEKIKGNLVLAHPMDTKHNV